MTPGEREVLRAVASGRRYGEGKPSSWEIVLEVLEVWRVWSLVTASTRLEARCLGGFLRVPGGMRRAPGGIMGGKKGLQPQILGQKIDAF